MSWGRRAVAATALALGASSADAQGLRTPVTLGEGGSGPEVTSGPPDAWTPPWAGDADVSGTLVAWHPVRLAFRGPLASETDDAPNPFLDYRLVVLVRGPSGQASVIPGYFDGDGLGGGTGDVWVANFVPEEGGTWTYEAFFDADPDIAVNLNMNQGVPLAPDGDAGSVQIAPRDPQAPGFHKWGRLDYVGGRYLQFADGPYFLKGGTNSPENFLAYRGFDNTVDQPGGLSTAGLVDGLHDFEPHRQDFGPGGLGGPDDPLWVSADTGVDSRGIVGALNYLSSVGVNSIYFLPMNQGGDGRDTVPFVGYANTAFDKTHYDVSKLRQWGLLLDHAQRRGILLHVVLGETEVGNETWLDGGALGVERMLFFREMVARFGHALALKWNLGEESDLSAADVQAWATYLRAQDPYDHPIAVHTNLLDGTGPYPLYDALLGMPQIQMTSLQLLPADADFLVEYWRQRSMAAGQPWVVDVDEQGPAAVGLNDVNSDALRKEMLYDVYLGGAGGVEWYAGYYPLPLGGDVRLENFRTREAMWLDMQRARTLMQNLQFWLMSPADGLVSGESGAFGGAEVFFKPSSTYLVYYPDASSTGVLDLTEAVGTFTVKWYDPRTGAFTGLPSVSGGAPYVVGPPPSSPNEDWVLLVRE